MISSANGHVSSVTAFETFGHLLCPGVNSRGMKGFFHGNDYTGMFMAALFITFPNWKQPNCSSREDTATNSGIVIQ